MNKNKLECLDSIIKQINNMKKRLEYLKDDLEDLKDKKQEAFSDLFNEQQNSEEDELRENIHAFRAKSNVKSLHLRDTIEVKVLNYFTGLTTKEDEIQDLETIKQRLLDNVSRIDSGIERIKNLNVMDSSKIEICIFDYPVGVMTEDEGIQFIEEITQQLQEDISNINSGIERIKNLNVMKGSENE